MVNPEFPEFPGVIEAKEGEVGRAGRQRLVMKLLPGDVMKDKLLPSTSNLLDLPHLQLR
jgi:hypothetical protein